MTFKHTTAGLIPAILLLLSFHATAQDWATYSSDNLTIHSDGPAGEIEELLGNLEVFRGIVLQVLGLPNAPDNQKLKIIMFDDFSEYRRIRPGEASGFFFNGNAGPRMVIGPYGRDSQHILFHEYVHYLTSEHASLHYPRWYNEGLADLLSSVEFTRDQIRIGKIPDVRRNWLEHAQLMDMEDLVRLEPTEGQSNNDMFQGRFYAMSWVFMHYLMIGSLLDGSNLIEQTNDYLVRFHNGEDSLDAFVASFGVTPEEMDGRLANYMRRRGQAVVTWPAREYGGAIDSASLPANEENVLLAELATSLGQEDAALDYLERIDETAPEAARGLAIRAIIENHREQVAAARESADGSLALDPQDSLAFSALAHYAWDSYLRAVEQSEGGGDFLARALEYADRAIAIDRSNSEAYYLKASAHEALDEIDRAVESMLAVYELAPSHSVFNLYLSKLLITVNSLEPARALVRRVYSASHSFEQREQLQELLDQIDAGNVDMDSEAFQRLTQ